MPHKTQLTLNIDPALKTAGQAVAQNLGLDLSTVVQQLITTMVAEQRLPFTPTDLPAAA
ncbi:type II toxin-antitoxin system RelB/DinJ family antitoxin [Loigolactobacillus bifermentans]|uniref:Addiction module antitoxin, RelB/DinJ family n=1 Tax=Loigolactobacillus bifermentans DSM 20003 TaxID=1423726 RepID=A0A0R1GKH9_9LACO|nr:type II toxin-antitoxin system RelB/DinJ family antitoxin [Loigolactobacillus bifermentans]KRK34598.1 hypothetical protein FC07_GL000347 [Loigolactobacillus bifermentans DSM 20003]QGG61132.1 hypothetical protein LB003_12020 [Loigolactobacillus bifermentans]